jgi:3-phenylpropionate/trans-cinnamate dioxygenase ferredoxin reductase subunit
LTQEGANIVVVGGGQAACSFVETLRILGNRLPIALISDESVWPYQRPPLSKDFLLSIADSSSLELQSEGFYAELGINANLSCRATAIDRDKREIHLKDGTTVAYRTLALMTGARARQLALPGADCSNIFKLRSIDDATAIRCAAAHGMRAVVIGGGYLGLEVAASFRVLGLDVTVVETSDRLLGRVASREIADTVRARHLEAGVVLYLSRKVVGIGRTEKRAHTVVLEDGTALPADIVVVAIGGIANDELARTAGLATRNGIVTDADGRTSDPAIFAAGDCAARTDPASTDLVRPQSVQNAILMGQRAARSICGVSQPPMEPPWFWSRQYDCSLQIVGFPQDGTSRKVESETDGSLVVKHFSDDGKLVCTESINAPRAIAESRRVLTQRYAALAFDGRGLTAADGLTKLPVVAKRNDLLRLCFATPGQASTWVEVPEGTTVKDAALTNGIPGVLGECGGSFACATCHVYVDHEWLAAVGAPGKVEKEMLRLAFDARSNSRLGCRLRVSRPLDGLVVTVPKRQI